MVNRPGVGGASCAAGLECSVCGKTRHISLRANMPPEQIDQKFQQAGWRLDPHRCPDCITAAKETKRAMTASAKPTAAAMRAQAEMIQLLAENFDKGKGAFADGYTDERIAKETGLALDVVREYRLACFGELKEPNEIGLLRADIKALEELHKESAASFAQGVAELRGKLARLSSKWGA